MSKFLIIFLSVYGSAHALVFVRMRALLPHGRPAHVAGALVMAALMLAPIISRILERQGHDPAARVLAHIGYYWMGFIFLAFTASCVMLAGDILLRLVNAAFKQNIPLLYGRKPAAVMVGLVLACCAYGLYEARSLRIETVALKTPKLPPGVDDLAIAQITDVHLGAMTGADRMAAIADRVNALAPDVIVCTGDFIDGAAERLRDIPPIIRGMPARLGKFAVTGNHEYYAGIDGSVRFLEDCGFRVLRGEAVRAGDAIDIAGVDDRRSGDAGLEAELLSSLQSDRFTLYLKHRPLVSDAALGLFDLQLSGHTHAGQIFPFRYMVGLSFRYVDGFFALGRGSHLYVSRGTGTWGPQMRLLAPPEITLIRLTRS